MRPESRELIILFTRYPEPGKVKTRLIPRLGAEGACQLHRRMADKALGVLKGLSRTKPVFIEVWYEGGSEALMEEWWGPGLPCLPQGEGDLGCRMDRAFTTAFQRGFGPVVLVGSDCPALSEEILAQALISLGHHDLVVGPARDGGYYLIGLRKRIPSLFLDIPWGTGEVLAKTLKEAKRLALEVDLLEALPDVDRPGDLEDCGLTITS